MSEDRRKLLAQRFSKRTEDSQETPTQTQEKKKSKTVERSRHSLYLDKIVVGRVDKAYKDVAHDLYPTELDKAAFMEALLEYGLTHISEVKARLSNQIIEGN